ncbi:MAG: YegS/Rv2252/BmrU family lipid kinase [Thermomicrobiales bacterium]|nr:YegS/Rv2252/BmrU family lipid kinase [Thermomicrobiales bacterium]
MRIAIVFNPGSGRRAATTSLGQVTSALASHNHTIEVFDRVAEPDFEAAIRREAHDFDRVIAIGGDGTLNGVVNGVMTSDHPQLPIAFVPTGRGKDTARALTSWKAEALGDGVFEAAEAVPTDLVRIELASGTTRYAINVANIGLAAHAAHLANGMPRWLGSLSYVLGAGRAIVPPREFAVRMCIDGDVIAINNALLLSVCNGRAMGGGIYIAPEADQHDGLLDIVIAANAHLGDLALQLPKLKSGKPFDHKALHRWRGEEVTLQPTSTTWFDADGERLNTQPLKLAVAAGAVNWIAPQ